MSLRSTVRHICECRTTICRVPYCDVTILWSGKLHNLFLVSQEQKNRRSVRCRVAQSTTAANKNCLFIGANVVGNSILLGDPQCI